MVKNRQKLNFYDPGDKVTRIEVCQEPVTNLRQYHQSKPDAVNSYLEMLNLRYDIFRDYLVTARYKQL